MAGGLRPAGVTARRLHQAAIPLHSSAALSGTGTGGLAEVASSIRRPSADERRRALIVLRAGNLPPETSPADPRYVQAKREVERKGDKRELNYTVASLVVMLALILIAVFDGALWFVVISGCALVIGLVSGYRKGRASP